MSLIQKKVIDVFRTYPELLVQTEDHSLYAKRRHLHEKFLLFMDKIDFKVNYDSKHYKDIINMFQMIHVFDIELVVKMAIQFSLWGETVYNLGTNKHLPFIRKTEELDIFGCFAMTEIGHGSNIRKLETTATYHHDTRSFTIHSPLHSSHKYWIGQSSMFAHYAVVFAQLYINNENKGVHPFIVQLRDTSSNEICKHISIKDCGIKNGLNSIDNGHIIFNQVVIPYDYLLDKYAHIDTHGHYHKVDRRFSKMVHELTKNRMGLGMGANLISRYSLQQALEYTKERKQFGTRLQEIPIIQYTTTQHRLLPLMARTYMNMLFNQYAIEQLEHTDTLHFNSIITKTNGTWNALRVLQQCRECCGGHGYHYHSYFGKMYRNLDIYTTFEGDNTVLLQQLVQIMLGEYKDTVTTLNIVKYKLLKYLNYVQYILPNIIANASNEFDIYKFKQYIQNRIEYKLYSLMLYFNTKKKEGMDPFMMWTSKLTHINDLGHLISFHQTLDVALFSINDVNRPLIHIFILQHIKENGLFYLVDNSISINIVNNIHILLERNYQKIINNMDTYIQLLDVPNIDSILNNHLHTIRSVL